MIVIGNIKLLMCFINRIFEQLRHTRSDLMYIFLGEEVFVSQTMQLLTLSDSLLQIPRLLKNKLKERLGLDGFFVLDGQGSSKILDSFSFSFLDHSYYIY